MAQYHVLNACRTPIGVLGGALKAFTAPALAGAALRGVLAGVEGRVESCVLGQAVQAGSGANPAREAARLGGLPSTVAALTVNQGLLSGLQALLLAARDEAGLAVAGGMESASGAPYLLPSARWGTRMGAAPVLDALLVDAGWPQGGEDRREADRLRVLAARDAGWLQAELTGEGQDALPLPTGGLLPADGAAVVLLGSERHAKDHPPLARIAGWARGEGEAEAARHALHKAGLAAGAIDRWELDSPLPGLDPARVNAWGGAASLGLALGAEGARKVVTLAHQLRQGRLRYGLAALEADGLGLALILESL